MESECFVVAAVVFFYLLWLQYCGAMVNVSLPFWFQKKKEQEMERKRKEKEEKVSFGDTFNKTSLPSTGQRQTDEEVAIGLFSLTKSKIKTLFQASIIDIIDSCSKLFTLNCKQTLLDTEPFLLALQ